MVWNIRKVGLLTYQNGCFMGFNGWLMVWNMNGWIIFSYIGNVIIPTDSYFSEGWLSHQPDYKNPMEKP